MAGSLHELPQSESTPTCSTSNQTALTATLRMNCYGRTNLQPTRTAGIDRVSTNSHTLTDCVTCHWLTALPQRSRAVALWTNCQSALVMTSSPNWQPGRIVTVCVNCHSLREMLPVGRYDPNVINFVEQLRRKQSIH